MYDYREKVPKYDEMTKTMKSAIFSISMLTLFVACKETNLLKPTPISVGVVDSFDPNKVPNVLKNLTDVPVGMAVHLEELNSNGSRWSDIVQSEFDNVTLGYNMKHGDVVKTNGNLDFSNADRLINSLGMPVFGHVLAWHQNNNGDYLRSLASGGNVVVGGNMLPNGDFELGSESSFTNWSNLVGGTAEGIFALESVDVAPNTDSKRALKAVVNKTGTNAWDVQSLGPNFTANAGKIYRISAFIKSASGGGRLKLIVQNEQYLENQLSFTNSNWNSYVWDATINEANPQFKIHFNGEGTYVIDNVKIEALEAASATDNTEIVSKVDAALKSWVQGSIKHYPNIKAWDAINEVFTDGAVNLRNGVSTGDTYYWAQYLGRNYIYKTFQYAKEACGDCEFFINDYNLEINTAKLDSTIALAKELQSKGYSVAGIGTQMHMSIDTPNDQIDTMFKKLAATGLKIRISELDIRVNPNNAAGFLLSAHILKLQAEKYAFVVTSYFNNIPASQRHGITVWGVSDKDTWINNATRTDYPLLWDREFRKKAAYAGFANALR